MNKITVSFLDIGRNKNQWQTTLTDVGKLTETWMVRQIHRHGQVLSRQIDIDGEITIGDQGTVSGEFEVIAGVRIIGKVQVTGTLDRRTVDRLKIVVNEDAGE